VHDRAHKTQIRQAVEEIFGVRVLEVRTMSVKSKPKRRGSLAVIDATDFDTPSAKRAAEGLAAFGEPGRTLVVLGREGEDTCFKSFRNLKGVAVHAQDAVGVADIIGAQRLVLSPAAVEYLTTIARKPEREAATA
ncbi:50S ribosomal protein L4, partial [Baekduia sp.]|uniref:50S ribosomal protein L4 n=1 Tax=Baekduia sp. TaxID=2600305 RepID=UPI002E0C5FD5|nr:50S ribosomal protein L4 [Baekduia sp.]